MFETALQQSASFRAQVFSAFSSHLSDMIVLVEEVAFGKLDVRLAKHLLAQRDENDTLTATHQNIATELGSAREVISRQLKELESRELVEVNRGKILLTDIAGLKALAIS
jgi:CRP/FNR family transcriptional regulator